MVFDRVCDMGPDRPRFEFLPKFHRVRTESGRVRIDLENPEPWDAPEALDDMMTVLSDNGHFRKKGSQETGDATLPGAGCSIRDFIQPGPGQPREIIPSPEKET